jgi:DnaJ-class molecular chaperone
VSVLVGVRKHELQEGEVVCDKCGGSGVDRIIKGTVLGCLKCKGDGFLDWVEKVVGKKSSIYICDIHDIWYAPAGFQRMELK